MSVDYAYEAKELSKVVYGKNDGTVPVGYSKVTFGDVQEPQDHFENDDGFYAEAYSNGKTTIIAVRGTDDWDSPDKANNTQMVAQREPNFAKDLKEFIKVLSNSNQLTGQEVVLTGHSAGGSAAQIVGAEKGYETITFNAYGTKAILDRKGFYQAANCCSLFCPGSYDQNW